MVSAAVGPPDREGPHLECQRALFDLPDEVTYLDAAAYGPLPLSVRDAGLHGVAVKAAPWTLDRAALDALAERVRAAAAALIGASAGDVAIMGSVSHALATAGSMLPVAPSHRVLRVAGEQSSNCLAWTQLAQASGATLEVVPRPADGDWTSAVLERIALAGAPPVGLAALTPCHWTDGSLVDLDRIAPVLREQGGLLAVDATQAVGALPIDVRVLGPDILAFPTYKWVLGPYNLAFLYVAPRWQAGEPLERNGFNCRTDAACVTFDFAEGARRYDMGERNNPVALPMAEAALALVSGLGPAAIQRRLRGLTDGLAGIVEAQGLQVPARGRRVANILGVRLPGGMQRGLVESLSASGVHASDRQGVLRLSPHVYNNAADLAHFAKALSKALRTTDGLGT